MLKIKAAIFNPENLTDLTKMKKHIKRLEKRKLKLAIISNMLDSELYSMLVENHLHYDKHNNACFDADIGLGAFGIKSFLTRLKMVIGFLNDIYVLPEEYKKLSKSGLFTEMRPEEILFISSKKENITLAKRFGIKTVCI